MADVKIEVRENGPLRFTGPITITDKDGKAYGVPDGEIVSFCRCGLSQNKPFCDGAHRDGGFQGDSVARYRLFRLPNYKERHPDRGAVLCNQKLLNWSDRFGVSREQT